jgi:hypothetical protein
LDSGKAGDLTLFKDIMGGDYGKAVLAKLSKFKEG